MGLGMTSDGLRAAPDAPLGLQELRMRQTETARAQMQN